MTQPTWASDVHAGMLAKLPPTVRPTGTVTLPPSTMADTRSLRRAGSASTWRRRSPMSMPAPCEWPMTMTPRPWLSWAR